MDRAELHREQAAAKKKRRKQRRAYREGEAAAGRPSSRLQFSEADQAKPELQGAIRKSDKAADRLDAVRDAIPNKSPGKPHSWLKDHGMPPITRVYKTTRDGKRLTLEDECLQSCSLPSIAYGFKRCSLKHKIGPQEKFCNHYPLCQKAWAAGKRVVKFIGYDAGEGYRSDKVLLGDLADRKYSKWYPLMEWGWTRDDCIRQIEAAGLPQPGKSSCFFCPSMKPDEITALREQHPDLFRRALALEDNARQTLKTVKGLGRNYSWRERFGKEFCTHGNG